jgi:hypothetical protein
MGTFQIFPDFRGDQCLFVWWLAGSPGPACGIVLKTNRLPGVGGGNSFGGPESGGADNEH